MAMREVTIDELAENASNPSFADDRMGVQFYMHIEEDAEATLREGMRKFKETEYVKIYAPGNRDPIKNGRINRTGNPDTDERLRWPRHYAQFKSKQEQVIEGIPLTLWPRVSAVLAEELKFINIHTVEQLAVLNDTYINKVPKGHELKRLAAEFLAGQKDQQQVAKLQSELAERDNRITALETAVNEQSARIERLMKKLEK